MIVQFSNYCITQNLFWFLFVLLVTVGERERESRRKLALPTYTR